MKDRPWSKLQKQIYNLIDEKINFQIHCVAHRMRWKSDTTPTRYWITLGKEVLWDYPKDFAKTTDVVYDGWWFCKNANGTQNYAGEFEFYPYTTDISDISNFIRDYINTSKNELFEKEFESDKWGLTDILKAADRRIGKDRLLALKIKTKSISANKIIEERLKANAPIHQSIRTQVDYVS